MEHKILNAVYNNDLEGLKVLLVENGAKGLDMLAGCDEFGRSAVEVAVEVGSVQAAEVLLNHRVPACRALLYAVDREDIEAVRLLLSPRYAKVPRLQYQVENHDFEQSMTPTKLAAIKNNYDILQILLQSGFPAPSPDEHKWAVNFQSSCAWLTSYRAVCSPSFILLTSSDPFRTAFRTARALRDICWRRENYRAQLEELADQCEIFAHELLDEVRDEDELETVLGFTQREDEDKDLKTTLEVAVDLHQKKFVSHPFCFDYIDTLNGGMLNDYSEQWQQWSKSHCTLFALAITFSYPFLCVLHIFAPTSKLGRIMESPIVRQLCWTWYSLDLLVMLLLDSQLYRVSPEELDRMVHGIEPTHALRWTQMLIFIFMAGRFVQAVNDVWYQGLVSYFKHFWSVLDFAGIALYTTHVTLLLLVPYDDMDISLDWEARARADSFQTVAVADAVFSVFTLVQFLRALSVFGMFRYLGSLQISFGRMVMDIVKFVLFLGLVMIAFACGFNQLYWFYGTVHDYLCDNYGQSNLMTVGCEKTHGYGTLFETMQTLFWAEFGITDLSMLELKPGNSPVGVLQIQEQPVFTEGVGRVMYALYHVIVVLVLLNLLIAIMSASYQGTVDNKDREWIYYQTKDTLFHMRGNLTLPPPFNLLMALKKGVVSLICLLSSSCGEQVDIARPTLSGGREKFKAVIDKLSKRYRRRKQRRSLTNLDPWKQKNGDQCESGHMDT